ncbi:P-loop containing nucleoside triphosphate hydrolase protein, partial [Syncephalis pseudoplumigaleata]
LLIDHLTLDLGLGQHLLITGANGTGKTSLLRVLCGLWPTTTGDCVYYGELQPHHVQLLPQQPYIVAGSLRDQLAYPGAAHTVSDATLQHTLTSAGLDYLLLKVDSPDTDYGTEWTRILSPGEAQRLAFARLLHHRPKLAVLDEATSAIDETAEGMLYRHAIDAGITVVSIGHRESLRAFHTRELHLNGTRNEQNALEGSYALRAIGA